MLRDLGPCMIVGDTCQHWILNIDAFRRRSTSHFIQAEPSCSLHNKRDFPSIASRSPYSNKPLICTPKDCIAVYSVNTWPGATIFCIYIEWYIAYTLVQKFSWVAMVLGGNLMKSRKWTFLTKMRHLYSVTIWRHNHNQIWLGVSHFIPPE
jgi:hypothetical protein